MPLSVAKHAGLGSASFRMRQELEQKLRAASLLKCSNPACAVEVEESSAGGGGGGPTGGMVLQRCACHLASYCDNACQKADWPAHKSMCKAKRAEMAEIVQAVAEAREKAEAEATAAAAALLEEVDKRGTGGKGHVS